MAMFWMEDKNISSWENHLSDNRATNRKGLRYAKYINFFRENKAEEF